MTRCLLALGSNVGDREHHLLEARESLVRRGVTLVKSSTVLETEPWGVTDQPSFLNQVLVCDWGGSPWELLGVTKSVESEVGRNPGRRWGPRELDVDILVLGDFRLDEAVLTIPHPGIHRPYLRDILLEVAPDILESGA